MKIIIVATHPIQYQVPWFRLLSVQKGIDLKVLYALVPDENEQGAGFGVPFSWDIPMLEGYKWELLPNSRKEPNLRVFRGSSTPKVYSVLRKEKPDVVVITGWQSLPLLQSLSACMKLRIPRIIRGESNALRLRSAWVKLIHRLLLSRFDAFLSIGKTNREFYLNYGIPEEAIFTCNYFVDNGWFQKRLNEVHEERDDIRSGWDIKKNDVCFVYAGKLIPKKRVLDLLTAFEKACRMRENIQLLVVGAGELMEPAQRFVSEHKLPVTFTGFLNQSAIVKAYAAADCLVLPSDYGETWGLVVNEAMACGLPAIVSDRVGCWPDLVENKVTGFLFPFGDVYSLAERLVELASDKGKLLQMGNNAAEKIKEYSVEKAVEGTVKAIEYVARV
ncbi:MAG TPA: glycosyltransferase family 4 protein [Dissulfurispiraceae bacterium]|nr:glycosyltransferase family 4 protein [Dissulfurispiraceae bacterium]